MAKKSKNTGAAPNMKATKQVIAYLYRVLGLQPLSVQIDPQTLQKWLC